MSTPLATVKERFESKAKLIAAVKELATDDLWIDRLSSDRGGNKGLEHVSNAKLLRLHDMLSEVKEQFGSRAKLIDALIEMGKRTGDEGYRTHLERYPIARLLDLHRARGKGSASKGSARRKADSSAKSK